MGWDNKMPLKQHGNYAQCEYHQQTAGTDNGAVGMGFPPMDEKVRGFWGNSAENASFISFVTCWIFIFSSFLLHLSSGCVKNHDLAIMRQMCALGMPTTLANKRAVRYRFTGTHGG